jgi:hypothetical protein
LYDTFSHRFLHPARIIDESSSFDNTPGGVDVGVRTRIARSCAAGSFADLTQASIDLPIKRRRRCGDDQFSGDDTGQLNN